MILGVRKMGLKNIALLLMFLVGTFSQTAEAGAAKAVPVVSSRSEYPGQEVVRKFVSTIVDSRKHLAAAAVARSVSIFAVYPVDTIKTRLQMGKKINWGLATLYNGVGGSLFGQVPYGVLTFGSYEIYKQALLKKFSNAPPVVLFAAAALLGDVTGSGWLCPSEVVKQQIQAGMHSDTISALKNIWKKDGFPGFYQGYFGGLARDVPFRVAQLTSYEVTKNLYLNQKKKWLLKKDNKVAPTLSALDSAICGAIAGTFSAAVTCPLDRFKTLLMTDSATYGGNVMACASKVWKDEGIRGLTVGMVPRVAYIVPSVTIFFIAYEQVQQRLSGN